MARKLEPRLLLLLLTFTAGVLLLDSCQADEEVSFYGASYIHLLVQEAKSATDISFRFRTQLSEAMLLLAAGRTDYCLIKLEAGRLKVHINLGAGEKELASARELQLNDLSWHSVNLTRRNANITLVIDGIHSVSDVLPGRFFELNINFGLYIGGQGGFNELFLGHTEYLRGCMSDITYNGLQVIEHARARRNSTEANAVSWGCSAEFDANSHTEVSFVEDGAFTAIPRSIPRSGSRWELDVKTVANEGLLLFMAGLSSHADFLGVELKNGHIRLIMNKGNGATELIHPTMIADGNWHSVQVDFTTSFIGIGIDGEAHNQSLASGNRYLDLADTLYIGGTELNKRAKALSKDLRGDISYKGCLRNMRLDNKDLGLPHVKVSQGIVVHCVWGFPCAETKPCVSGALCSQLGVRSFKCTCDRDLCIKSNFTEEYKFNTNLPVNLELLKIRDVQVLEGKKAALMDKHVSLILDIGRYQLNESHVVFALLTPPSHGWLQADRTRLAVKTPFTLHDLHMQKIVYMHDGSETISDSMVLKFAVQAASPRHPLPNYFQDSLRFELRVNVTPVNDPPRLEIPNNAVLTLAQGTRRTLTKELIWAEDSDTPPDKLVYTVLPDDSDIGHVEKLSSSDVDGYSGTAVRSFTQAELARGLIDYVHSGKNKTSATLPLRVSDGEATSQIQKLRITAHKLTIRPVRNTGLIVVHRSFSYLTSANLSFATNADNPRVELHYNVTGKPKYGILQRQREATYTWINTDHFTSRDLDHQTVRYLHTVASPHNDSFRFEVSLREVHSRDTYDFNVTFITLELLEIQRSSVDFVNSAEVVVDSRRIKFQTNPLLTDASLVVYSLLKIPNFGHLYLANERLMIGQTFTQEDVDNGRLRYRHFRRAFSPIDDHIEFKVSAPQCQDVTTSLHFNYQPTKESNLAFEGAEIVRVLEGQKVPLSMARFDYRHFGVTSLSFNLTSKPRHGCLSLYEATLPVVLNITHFTLEELNRRAVFYVHDDTETKEDAFEFLAMSTDDTDFMYIDRVNVQVELRNDNSPKRINRRIFHVVTNSEKLITRADLLYSDDDLNTKPSDLVYHVKQLSNGSVHKVNNPRNKIEWFTQQDIDNEKVVYRHQGNAYERIDFTVSDGELFSNGDLEIQAGQAYVKLILHKGAVVQTNRSVLLSARDIEVETNVYANSTEIVYHVRERPKYGVILKFGKETWNFNREDLLRQHVVYRHVRPPNREIVEDKFGLRVNVGRAEDSGEFGIKVYPEIYWEPLIVRHNSTIYVEEATSVILNNKSLSVGYNGIPSNKVIYHVRQWPRHGYLEVQSYEDDDDFDELNTNLVKHFGQNLIDEHHVSYVQSTPNQTHDAFVVDITNGITWLRNLTINIVIVPDKLYVAARNLSVLEGKSVILQDFDFYTVTPYFAGKITEYKIAEKPRHGNMVDLWNNPIRNFAHKQLVSKEIVYKNNGDEQTVDRMRMIVKAGEKSSQPFDVWINVVPINDEPPSVVNKSVFSMWQGGSVIMSRDLLAAVDNDTTNNEIVFEIQNIVGGYFSMKETPGITIRNFSQEMINEQRVLFTHTNGSRAEIKFSVFDGLHRTDVQKLLVTTKPVQVLIGHNDMLHVFPLARKLITNDHLLTKCTDPDRDVKYFIRSGPSMGRIMMETSDGISLKVDRFTQQDLNNSRVSYEHHKQFNNLSASDSFVFDVEAHFATPIQNQVFEIKISVSSGGLHHYVSIDPVLVVEGKKAPVRVNVSGIVDFLRTKAAIANPDVSVRLLRQPNYGHVMLEPNNLNLTTFSQNEVESGRITYYHDNSDTLKDEIELSVYFSPGLLTLCNISVPVEITPVNDQPFKLEKNQLRAIIVVQNQTQTVTRENLLTTDPDTGPEGIVYELMNIPQGRFLLFDNSSEVQQVTRFTQRDIDSSRLVYEHRGSLSAKAIYYRVSDGQYEFDYNIMNVQVQPIRLNVSVTKPVEIRQGSTSANIDTEVLNLDTNVRHELVIYQVTRPPRHGALHARESSVIFRHADLVSKSVFYVQNDLTSSNDSIVLSARVAEKEQIDINIPIVVAPLMIMSKDFVAYAGDKSKLTIAYFDATPLWKLSDSEPKFRVTRRPKYAKIMQIVNRTTSAGEKRDVLEREVTRFDFDQIRSGLIYLVCNQVPSDDPLGVKDSFEFLVNVPGSIRRFQPAMGSFDFHAKLANDYYNNSLDGPMDPVGHEGEMPIAPNMSDDYTLLLGMLCGVVLLSLCVIVTIRCRQSRFKVEDDEDEEEEDEDVDCRDKVEPASPASVMSLPRPPDHLLPATPHLKRYTNDLHNNSIGSSTPLPPLMPTLTSTLPQCKVIPLSPMDTMTGSEVDVSARYPYGVADSVDDWSSFDTTEIPCPSQTSQRTTNPLLRRNQYWV